MGAAQHGAAAAGYGRPRFLAYGRVRVTHSPENSAGCGFGPMFQIKCHALEYAYGGEGTVAPGIT